MNILRNAGTHKILAIMHPLEGGDPLTLIELAGRTSYQSRDKITTDSSAVFVRRIIERKHESVLEHSAMTVQFDNCSIGMTRELDRHRLCGITEESTRYVDESDFNVVVPPHIKSPVHIAEIHNAYSECERGYRQLRQMGVPAQDARQVLPLAITCQTVLTANFREWRHIFKMRTAQAAHWEIRRVLIQLLADVQDRIPVVFDDIIPEFTSTEALDWGLADVHW